MPKRFAQEPDPRIIARLRDGDITALSAIFKSYSRQVYGLARRMMGAAADAEDVTQEVFLRAFEQVGTFRGEARFSTWLHRLAIHHCLNKLKQRQREDRHKRAVAREAHRVGSAPANPPGQGPDAAEQREIVQALLQDLAPQYRACLVLRELEQLSYEEIAACLEIPVGTVMSRLSRARGLLRRRLTEAGGAARFLGNISEP